MGYDIFIKVQVNYTKTFFGQTKTSQKVWQLPVAVHFQQIYGSSWICYNTWHYVCTYRRKLHPFSDKLKLMCLCVCEGLTYLTHKVKTTQESWGGVLSEKSKHPEKQITALFVKHDSKWKTNLPWQFISHYTITTGITDMAQCRTIHGPVSIKWLTYNICYKTLFLCRSSYYIMAL